MRTIVVGLVLLLALFVGLTAAALTTLRWVAPPLSSVMLLEPGPFAAIDYRWVPRERISVALAHAVMAAEDQKFLSHDGFDFDSIGDSIQAYRRGGALRGASTITQQVAKNLFLSNSRSFFRKGVEAYLAIGLELLWPKWRILEVYVNVAEFGPGVFGAEAAAQQYFGKPAAQLSQREAALLAAVLPNPKRLSVVTPGAYVRQRRDAILEEMRLLERRGHFKGLDWPS